MVRACRAARPRTPGIETSGAPGGAAYFRRARRPKSGSDRNRRSAPWPSDSAQPVFTMCKRSRIQGRGRSVLAAHADERAERGQRVRVLILVRHRYSFSFLRRSFRRWRVRRRGGRSSTACVAKLTNRSRRHLTEIVMQRLEQPVVAIEEGVRVVVRGVASELAQLVLHFFG